MSRIERARELAPRAAFEAVFAAVSVYAARPAFASLHLPLQDLPQHMAAISVLKRYAFEPGLRAYFELTLSRTQYLLVYALGVVLSVPFGVEYATRLLVALTVIATPFALRYAIRRTGGDARWAALAWPFLWNPQMMLGFLNYLLGIPIALWGIGLFADPVERTSRRRQLQLAALALAAFYSHLIPYGLLGLGVLLSLDARELRRTDSSPPVNVSPRDGLIGAVSAAGPMARRWLRELRFLAPSLVAVVVWIVRSPARDASVRAGGVGREIVLTWPDRLQLPAQFRETVLNVGGDSDDRAMIAWGLGLLAAIALARRAPSESADARWIAPARVAWLPFACAALYVFSPESYGWIWPIHTRFAVAAVLLLPLALGRARSHVIAWAIVGAMAWATVGITHDLVVSFQSWDRDELGDLDAAIAHARPGRRLIALVPAMRSAHVPGNVPLLHAAAYYQARGGAVATFSFADFPQSPFRYRESALRPPRLRPRWEWDTPLLEADPRLDYYDYVLARVGYTDQAASLHDAYDRIFAGEYWNLYERRH